ncbi:nucleotidyltransferase family protein [Salinibacter sp.]|uniref:nucleotidyltransferase family protein n=1 Tax=Salinibacter sp. TaxID=2065818 RepID=UPI0021E70CDD|nr:nucleotidyltransferase family protein [Salinibacter sp.]
MPTLDDIRAQLRAELPTLRECYNVDRLGICGSYVRGEQTEDSDLDLLVTFTETPGLIEFVELEHYLEDTLGLSVDLGMPDGLKDEPAAENIRREVEYL